MVEWRDDVSTVIDPLVSPRYWMHDVPAWVSGDLCSTVIYGDGGILPRDVEDDLLMLEI